MPENKPARPISPAAPADYAGATPLLRQYFATRLEHPGILLLMRVGDFFEAYGEDAETIARELEITLTGREDGGFRVPMAGVPHHSSERYVARLIGKGYRVAMMDQVEDPRLAKGLVKRRVTRVVTPGTVLEESMLDGRRNNYLVAAVMGEPVVGVGVLDVSTGEFLTTEIEGDRRADRLLDEITRIDPAEVLVPAGMTDDLLDAIRGSCSAVITPYSAREAGRSRDSGRDTLLRHFQTQSLRGFGCEEYTAGLDACALVLRYLGETQAASLAHIRSLSTYSARDFLYLDGPARRHLELVQPLGEGGKSQTLLGVLDRTLSPMGARMIRRWIEEPLLDSGRIARRQDAVEELSGAAILLGDLRDLLRGMGDVERLITRCCAGLANARDLVALKEALVRLPQLSELLASTASERLVDISRRLSCRNEMADVIERAIAADPPMGLRDGGLIRQGFSAELDQLRDLSGNARNWIAALETTERAATGIPGLRVGYNAVFGYYIEVTRANVGKVPDRYIRKQTTAGGERYITPELKEYESQVLGADEKAAELEYDLFIHVRDRVAEAASDILALARSAAEADVLQSFAETAVRFQYVRPRVTDEDILEISAGRHPVIEQIAVGNYIPNDCCLDSEARMAIITGPNMSGKSSYLRQVALIVLMAQAGSFVPADSATVGLVDRIFTRVGAHDELASGQSTFMVEMNETANILNNATQRSLVVLDEIGRGTSTYDGLSIAWAVAEYLARTACKTLFATHYHHLNELARSTPSVRNFRVAVKEQGDHIVWLRKLVPGGTDKSYGIQVARMAGIPSEVIERAREVLRDLEKKGSSPDEARGAPPPRRQTVQLTLFEAEKHPIIEELEKIELATLTPVEALMYLDRWKRQLES